MLRLLLALFALATVVPSPVHAAEPALPLEIEAVLALPEDKIDIGLAALTFAHDAYPNDTDIQGYSKRIDEIADKVRAIQAVARARHLPGVKDGQDDTILALSEVFYNREGIKYDHSADALSNALDAFLPGVIERKKGTCTTMPMLYMAVAQRLGLHVYPVFTPQHMFLRFTDPGGRIRNFEATSNGTADDAWYIKEERVTDAAIKSGTYMRTLTHREFLAYLLSINGSFWLRHGQEARAIAYYERALKIDKRSAHALLGLTQIYVLKSIDGVDRAVYDLDKGYKTKAIEYLEKALRYRKTLSDLNIRLEDYQVKKEGPIDESAKTQ